MILPDYLAPGLDVVFCGTAAGNTSAQVGHFFANANNRFWWVLAEVGFTPEQLEPESDRRILEYGLGLTDLVKHHAGTDSTLRWEMYDVPGFERKIRKFAPRFVAFTSKRAGGDYMGLRDTGKISCGDQNLQIGTTAVWVLPSTSGMAGKHWDIKPWCALASLVRQHVRSTTSSRGRHTLP